MLLVRESKQLEEMEEKAVCQVPTDGQKAFLPMVITTSNSKVFNFTLTLLKGDNDQIL